MQRVPPAIVGGIGVVALLVIVALAVVLVGAIVVAANLASRKRE